MEYVTRSTHDTEKIAHKIITHIVSQKQKKGATILALCGDLGSGKTNFAQAFAKELGVTESVPSPTFILMRVYEIKKDAFTKFIHIDAYRLKDEDELRHIGWDDIIKDSKHIILIEWADKVEKAIPKNATRLYFEYIDETTRKITIKI